MSEQENNTTVATNDVVTVEPQDKVSGPKTHGGNHVDPDKFI